MFRWVQFLGALAAAGGAFWSGHRQIIGAEDDQIRNKKVIELSEQLRGHATGGDSFCYGHPAFFEGGHFHWLIIHEGEFPLTDVSVRIHNLERVGGPINVGRTIELGTIFPGRAHTVGEFAEIQKNSHGFNLFFLARNGSWTQEIRWTRYPTELKVANRVVRDGSTFEGPLFLKISDSFPIDLPSDDAWNTAPAYEELASRSAAPVFLHCSLPPCVSTARPVCNESIPIKGGWRVGFKTKRLRWSQEIGQLVKVYSTG